MPIYEYECQSCKDVFEIWQKISDEPKTECPKCSGPLTKLMSLTSFQLKGGGWYADGYSSKSLAASSERSGTQEKKGSESKAETKSETKSGKDLDKTAT